MSFIEFTILNNFVITVCVFIALSGLTKLYIIKQSEWNEKRQRYNRERWQQQINQQQWYPLAKIINTTTQDTNSFPIAQPAF